MPLTTFEEEIYLRALTGRLVGKAIADLGINKLAVIAPKNIICSSIATATEAAFLDHSDGVTRHFMVELGVNEEDVAKRVKDFDPQAILLQFGGESPIDQVKTSFVKTLKALTKEGIEKPLVFHVRIFAAGGVQEALKDSEIASYLGKVDKYVYTVDFDNGKVLVNRLHIDGNNLRLEKLREYQVTLEHADLLNRSLKDRRVTFQ
jgi:hypothetical protein